MVQSRTGWLHQYWGENGREKIMGGEKIRDFLSADTYKTNNAAVAWLVQFAHRLKPQSYY